MRSHALVLLFLAFFLNDVNAQGERLITKVTDWYPAVSPDGKRIVFHSDRNGSQAIYIIDTAGNNLKQLTNLGWVEGGPRWSPDGTKIVFGARPDSGNYEIFVINSDGSGIKRLTNVPGDDTHPNWSRDGKKIIFNSARTTPDLKLPWNTQVHEIFEMNADGSQPRQITDFKTISTYPCYSPDGKNIVFRRVTADPAFQWDLSMSGRNSEIFVCDINGGNPNNVSKNPAFDGWPEWSPDGNYIVFSSNRAGPANTGSIYIIKPDGSGVKKVSAGPMGYISPSWSRDGKWIYVLMNNETGDFGYGFIQRIPSTL